MHPLNILKIRANAKIMAIIPEKNASFFKSDIKFPLQYNKTIKRSIKATYKNIDPFNTYIKSC